MTSPNDGAYFLSNNTPSPMPKVQSTNGSRRVRLQSVAFHILTAFPVFWGIETLLSEHGFSSHDNILTQYTGHFITIVATCSLSIIWSGLCLLLHGCVPETLMRLGSLIQDVVMSSFLALFSMMICYRSFVVQSFSTIDCVVLGAGTFACMLHFGRLLAFAARVELPQLPYVDEGEYDLTQAMLYMFSVCSVTTSFSLKIIAQDTLLDTGSKHYSSAFVINSELLHTIGNVVVVWNLCNTICASFIPPVASSKIIATRLPPIAPVCLLMDLVSFVAMVVLSALCYASLSPLATIMNGTLSWAQIINESRSILAMAVGLFAGCCQGSLAISLISTYSSEKERAEVMRGLDQDGWLRYLDNFQQTDHDLVAFLKIPALSEKVRDRIASKIYNLPQDDSCRCNRWNRIRRYPLAKEELERYRSDQKVILHGLFPPTVSEDLELGIPQ